MSRQALVWFGYLNVPISGEYTFQVGYGDDLENLWVGDKALGSTWTRANSDVQVIYSGNPNARTVKITIEASGCVPVRFAVVNIGGIGAGSLKILSPQNEEITGTNSPFLRTECCST
jgi:hypothetical protein